jgi:hypothetical protein
VFAKGESLSISEPQGWQAAFREIAWNVVFPLSTAGGRWWVGVIRKMVTPHDDGTFEIDKTVFGRIKAGPRQPVAGPAP